METPVRWAMSHQPSFAWTTYVAGEGAGAEAVWPVRSTIPGCSTVVAVMPLRRWRVSIVTPVR